MSSPWSAIGVPIDSVGRAGGTEHAPAAVREHDLLARLGAEDRRDLDVRSTERAMPATDYLMPDGLEWDELAQLLAPLGASPALAGLSLGCLNPEKDPDGTYTERTCALLADALAAR